MKLPKQFNLMTKLPRPLVALVRKAIYVLSLLISFLRKVIFTLKEIAKSTTPVSGFMALVSVTLIAYITNLMFMFPTYSHSGGVIIMLVFGSLAVAIIVALDLVGNYERFKSIDAYIESEINKQTQENNGK